MIRKILVPTDYSPASLHGVDIAIQIARNNNDSLVQILHVTDSDPYMVDKEFREKAKHVFDAMSGNIRQKYGVPTEIIFSEGIAGPVISRIAFEKKPDLIVMGACGISRKKDMSIGTNALYVIRNAECPVLIIPEEKKSNGFTNVLYPVQPDRCMPWQFEIVKDLTAGSEPFYLEILAILHQRTGSEVDCLLGIIDMVEEVMNGGEKVRISLSDNMETNIQGEILQKVSDINADLLILSSTVDAANIDNRLGAFSHEFMNRVQIPFLSILSRQSPWLPSRSVN